MQNELTSLKWSILGALFWQLVDLREFTYYVPKLQAEIDHIYTFLSYLTMVITLHFTH